jgi:4-diphosphocytidyl-2-C-methyl-D-erythritol kinase
MTRVELSGPVTLFAPAKLNLGLEVIGRRPDGYHEVVTILQAVSLFDRLELAPAVDLDYEPPPGIADDLVARALGELSRRGIEVAARIRLEKHIPVAAGLGGGSSDAGTLLGALAVAGVPESLVYEIAATLGSDVPFFVRGGTALATGRGTELESLPTPAGWFVVVVPRLHLPGKTRRLYQALEPGDFSDGAAMRAQAEQLRQGLPLDPELIRNPFMRALEAYPEVRQAADALRAAGARSVWPAGAGPALFAVARDFAQARNLARFTTLPELEVFVCTTIGAGLNRERVERFVRLRT